MNRVHVPSLVLGFGLGMLMIALLGVLFFSGDRALSEEEVMERAIAMGMRLPQTVEGMTLAPDGSWKMHLESALSHTDLAARLHGAGVMENTLEFEIRARQESLQDPVAPGTYDLPAGVSVPDVVMIFQAGPVSQP